MCKCKVKMLYGMYMIERRFVPLCFILLLTLALWALSVGMARSGRASVAAPVRAELEKSRKRAAVGTAPKRERPNHPTVRIAGGIAVAGLVVAHTIRRKKV